ncbi:hypothetical protein PF010_g12865 [Phytophthora fragariae]|uniref:Uncharacterized protein n=1 Tax=Phytophthora fragariae TaxID=53985 RepID=A0A6A3U5K5_9STRA|nr:hypothetical protein PF003_g18952 [Phytophthora fragariae]KAE9004729.1 hypothetical protein PF011_g12334 [Phytophthora fragariae]KAE9105777.1 hypothetical protein PF010_g12865 [Phytophthora fragariae]KAE9142353.1 hypothetical protein PF006_g12528 [Phytophthora fragariae]
MEEMEAAMTEMTDELIEKPQDIRTREKKIEELSLMNLPSEMATVNDEGVELTNISENMRSELVEKEREMSALKDELELVDDLVNSWMLDIVHRKIREEATKSDMASDTVCCVQLKVEARLATGFLAQR